jgi:hypothetical protein
MERLFGPSRVADLETRLVAIERKIGELRAWQAVIVNELDKVNAHRSDASRTLAEWLQTHLDISKDTAIALVVAGRNSTRDGAPIQLDLAERTTFDRAVATHRLMKTGMAADEARATHTMNLERVRKLTAHRRRVTPVDEQKAFAERYLRIQPTLDESAWTITGRLSGVMGRVVDKAITQKADELRLLPCAETATRGQRQADALVAILQDSLASTTVDDSPDSVSASGHVTVFVDATGGESSEATAEVVFGPRIGPNVLEAILCGGTIRVIGMDGERPVAGSHATRAIPPTTRDAVLFRDGGCTIDGCHSRYRLEPHHITPWSHGGTHHPTNLTTLCWYHHHVAIHGDGFTIDPMSPSDRRRLVQATRRGPP